MKYIDADRLKVKLDEHYRKYQSKYMETRNPYTQGLIDALDLAEQVIDSLQQEQPEGDGDDGKFVKILVRKELAEQFQRLGDEIQAWQSSFVGAMNQREQMEVDFEKEIDDWYNTVGVPVTAEALRETARHFYELGLNIRKEE